MQRGPLLLLPLPLLQVLLLLGPVRLVEVLVPQVQQGPPLLALLLLLALPR